MKTSVKVIKYACPMCGCLVPFAEIKAVTTRWWKPRIDVTVEGDATDYVTHMWQHQEEGLA
jgi:hypothetical protein